MGQILDLFENDNYSTGVKQISMPAYQTSNGKIFYTKGEAEDYEASEQLIKDLVNNYQTWNNPNQVGGWTLRGMGDEFVRADCNTLEIYTRYIVSQIKG